MNIEDEKIGLQRDLDRFLQGLGAGLESLRRVRETYDERVAFEFNSVSFFHPNENKISEILAYFLNPHAKHGQKDKFLKIFAKEILPEQSKNKVQKLLEVEDQKVAIKTEFHTDGNRRIDIVIKIGQRDFFIGIENKIWAVDQSCQLDDYIQFLSEISSSKTESDYVLFYLSPYGKTPSEDSITKNKLDKLCHEGKVKIISYDKDIIALFGEFETACKADNVRAFIKDFIQYLKQRFLGEKVMGESEFITNFIVEDENNIKVALEILSSSNNIKQHLLKKIASDIENQAAKNAIICIFLNKDITKLQDNRYTRMLSFAKPCWTEAKIFFQFESTGMRDCCYGIKHSNYDLLKKITLSLGLENLNKKNSNCNGWYTYRHWNGKQPWIDMVTYNKDSNNIFIADLFDKVEKLIICAEYSAKEMNIKL